MIEVQMVFSWRHTLIPAVESAVNLAGTRWKRWDTEMCRGGAHVEEYALGISNHHFTRQSLEWYPGTGVSFQRQTISTKHYKMFFSAIGVASGCFETSFIFHRWDFRGHRPGTVPGWKPCRTMDDSVHHIHLTRSGRICVKKDNISKFNLNARFHVNISLLLKLKVWEFSKFYCLFGLKFFRFNSKILKHLCLFFLCSSTNRCSAAWCRKTGCFYRVVDKGRELKQRSEARENIDTVKEEAALWIVWATASPTP